MQESAYHPTHSYTMPLFDHQESETESDKIKYLIDTNSNIKLALFTK